MNSHKTDGKENQEKVAVIGAGIRGLCTAWELTKNGYSTIILEKQKFPGGLAGSIEHNNYHMDLGPHFFRLLRNSPISRDIKSLMGDKDLKEIQFSYKVYFHGHTLDVSYPEIYDIVFKFGGKFFLKSLFGLLSSKIKYYFKKDFLNAEEYLIKTYGKYLYYIWFKPYITERYGEPKNQTKDFIISHFPSFSFLTIFSYVLKKRLSKKIQNPKITKKNDEENVNWYFTYGMGHFIKKIIEYIENNNGKVHLNTEITSIDHENKIISFSNEKLKDKIKVDKIIYSTPPPISIKWFDNIPNYIKSTKPKGNRLNSIMVFLGINSSKLFDGWIMNVYDPNISFFRISQQSYLSDKVCPQGKSLLCLEIKVRDEQGLWNSDDEEIIVRIKNDLQKMKILTTQSIDDFKIIRMKGTYPILGEKDEDYSKILEFINSHNNEYIMSTVGSRIKNSGDIKPTSGGLNGALVNTRAIVQKIMNESKN